ncbi:MAG: serine/threonine-protein kinase [Gemmatimonadaceae bacterium]
MNLLSSAALARLRESLTGTPAPDRYRLREVIGEGGMGVVWRAHDVVLDREVAVKVLAAHLDDDALMLRLAREARLLAALAHPGIVPVFDLGTGDDGRAWYAMRLVEGQRLDAAAREGLSARDLLRVVEHVCDTVAYAHAHGVLHRDLKPGNVMIGPFGEVLVLDWGIAGPAGTEQGVIGTPGFMAPEQAVGTTDERSDIFGIGALIRDLLPPDATPPALQSIIAKACAVDPAARYQSPVDLRDDLRRFAAGDRVLAHRESLLERLQRFTTTYRAAILLVLAYLVMRVAILWWRGI